MAPRYKEADFPVHYRESEVRQIMSALYGLRSIAITGLAGMGKSNVVRFIVSHPQVRPQYLKERAEDYTFVHVDCAGMVSGDEAEILGEIAAQLHPDGISRSNSIQSPRNIRLVHREQILNVDPAVNLVIVLDYFDEAALKLDKTFFNYLFHLRNTRPRGNLSYIFATRRPMGHLGELQELLDDGCTIGPLNYKDAVDSILRDEARLGCALDPVQRDRLIACTGGHPGFLKNAAELLCSGKADASLPGEAFAQQLLRSEKIENLCQELWSDLTSVEQDILLNVARGIQLSPSADDANVIYIERSGLLVRKARERDEPDVTIFCRLFETFVRGLEPLLSGGINITAVLPNQARIKTPAGEESVTLSPKLFALLLALVKTQGQTVSADDLITQIYGEEAIGVTIAALSQLVKRLRGALNPCVCRLIDDPTYTCVETVRDVGYKFNG